MTNSRMKNRIIQSVKKIAKKFPDIILDDELMVLVETRFGNLIPMTSYQYMVSNHKNEYKIITYF